MTGKGTGADITLQINLSSGDLRYAEPIVRALVATHRADVQEVMVVADSCRPHSTALIHAAERFPAQEFSRRVDELRKICGSLQAAGVVDRVVWLERNPSALRKLNARYCGVSTPRTHDHLGHAFSAYFLGWESARTRLVAHFDGDILLWQAPGFRWLRHAATALARDESLIGASPRIAPPPAADSMVRIDAAGSGWLPTWPLERTQGGWRSPWFSTRCHLIDRERLAKQLPLLPRRGTGADRRAASLDRLLAPIYNSGALALAPSRVAHAVSGRVPAFPLPPEVLMHEHAQQRGFSALYLDDSRAWFIHPDTKPDSFARLLPQMLAAVAKGEYPESQRGVSGIQFAAWEKFLS